MNELIEQYLVALNKVGQWKGRQVLRFSLEEGRTGPLTGNKYVRIVQTFVVGSTPSVHSFVNPQTGEVFKAASWGTPAKGARYNLNTDMDILRGVADPYGIYLMNAEDRQLSKR